MTSYIPLQQLIAKQCSYLIWLFYFHFRQFRFFLFDKVQILLWAIFFFHQMVALSSSSQSLFSFRVLNLVIRIMWLLLEIGSYLYLDLQFCVRKFSANLSACVNGTVSVSISSGSSTLTISSSESLPSDPSPVTGVVSLKRHISHKCHIVTLTCSEERPEVRYAGLSWITELRVCGFISAMNWWAGLDGWSNGAVVDVVDDTESVGKDARRLRGKFINDESFNI